MICIQNATLVTPGRLAREATVLIEGDRFRAVEDRLAIPDGARVIDAAGLTLAPGLIDLQVNGGFGFDLTAAPESIWEVGARLPRYGVTAFLPTIISSPLETIGAAQAVLSVGSPSGYRGAFPLGLHLEGPFLSPSKRGAHNPVFLRLPEERLVEGWSPQRQVRMVTLAPELPGARAVIGRLAARGVVVSAGHSMADYEEAIAGLEAGITFGTHLFNAMPPFDHRAPGLVGALLADARAKVGLIPDGVHLHPAVVSLAWRSKGASRVSVVTDAMAALGMAPGRYSLGGSEVIVDKTSARQQDGRLAGSILSLDQAVRNMVAFSGCSLAQALMSATSTPAQLLGLTDRGRIAVGCIADATLWTPERRLVATLVRGGLVWKDKDRAWD